MGIEQTPSQKLFSVFSPQPLEAGRDDELYEDLDIVRGDSPIVQRIVRGIVNADRPRCQLFSGHIGSGKSSELNRASFRLRNDEKVFCVVVKAERDVDLNDTDAPEVLLAIVHQLIEAVRGLGIPLRAGLLQERLSWLGDQLRKEPDLQSFDIGGEVVRVSVALKDSPDTRRKIRRLLEPDTGSWIAAANDVIDSARAALREQGYRDLALLIDDLDRIELRSAIEQPDSRDRYLFIDRSSVLTSLRCHTVFNVPLSLERSVDGQRLTQIYGQSSIPVVPMVKLVVPDTGKVHKPGVDAFRRVIKRRLDRAQMTEAQAFVSGVVERIILDSGGQLRMLSTMVRDALAYGDPPITMQAVERVERDMRRSFDHQLFEEHWAIIEHVRKYKQLPRTESNDHQIRGLLHNRVILAYANDKEWYDANPLLPVRPTGIGAGASTSARRKSSTKRKL